MNKNALPDRDTIAALIPHSGAMCLLDAVIECDEQSVRCRATGHRDAGNPLRDNGELHALCGIEYAAQAMAVHGALLGGADAVPGMLAAVREFEADVERLDDIADDLIVSAYRLIGDNTSLLYEFSLHAGSRCIMRGRAMVLLARASA